MMDESDIDNLKPEKSEDSRELPDNTKEVLAGTIVKTPENWTKETANYVTTNNGLEVVDIKQVATVYAVSIGNAETVPVPKGFFYVGGNLDTGVIISDNEEDKYDGNIDKTTWEYTRKLKENQFVWIPCKTSEYKKTDWGVQNSNWDATTPKSEMIQIEKYGGFYVARYEAGLAENIQEYTGNQINDGTNAPFNKDGIPQSESGKIPWIFINWTQSKKNAESMYNNYVSSGLITGTQWDVILNKLVEKTDLTETDLKSSSKWGNYKDTSIDFKGRTAKAYISSDFWYLPVFGKEMEGKTTNYGTNNNGDILTTGASSQTEKYHIFDIAGNVYEWTEEISTYTTSEQYRNIRGGGGMQAFSNAPACIRGGANTINNARPGVRFSCSTLYKIE